jgi:ABC-type multidrug transport system fused ATPase/permease subunit
MSVDYPVSLKIDYPDRKLNRLTSFFRIFTIIPILIVLFLLMGGSYQAGSKEAGAIVSGVGLVMLPLVLMLLFRRKYPKWWYDWNLNLSKFSYRVASYFYLMTDVYPSTDEEQNVQLEMPYPDAASLNRWLPLVKWFLAIPHFIVLCFLWIAALVVIIIAWFAILFTGKFPRGLFDFVLGVMRWGFRVMCYCMIMITDKYPPFALDT